MTLAPGTRFGGFEILGRIGAGAMGVVYRARDTRLRRDVAVKVLAEELNDADRIARFEREAQALASLNHPNIAQIYGFEDAPGSTPLQPARAIVMELVEGEDLSDRIARGALPVADVVEIAGQIAAAVSAAHEAGIVHRDLKPSNIRIRQDRVVKILDFGLAKPGAAVADLSSASTMASLTGAGEVLIGTPAYMSPEQARGHSADARSDIWAFGCIVYEMVSGVRPFKGTTVADTLVKILEREPDWDALPATTPPGLHRLLVRCLVKDPARRLSALADARFDLDEADAVSHGGHSTGLPKARRLWRGATATLLAIAAVVAGALLWRVTGGRPTDPPERVLALTTYPGIEAQPTFSPDGTQVAFSWDGERLDNEDIYVMVVGTDPPHRLTHDEARDVSPAWKPDGSQIAFARLDEHRTSIYVASPLGGSEQRLAEFPAPGTSTAPRGTADPFLSWSADGRWLAVSHLSIDEPSDVYLVAYDGSQQRTLLAAGPGKDYTAAAFSPRGHALAYAESGHVGVVELEPGNPSNVRKSPRRLSHDQGYVAGVAWSADAKEILYGRAAFASPTPPSLWRIAADGGSPPRRVELAGVASFPAVSRRGRVAFSRRDLNVDMFVLSSGERERVAASTFNEFDASFSPDGSKIAFATDRTGEGNEIWIVNRDGTGRRPLTRGARRPEGSPRWSPDGSRLAFDGVGDDGQRRVFVVDQAGGPIRTIPGKPGHFDQVPSWSHDGKWLYFGSNRSGRSEIWRTAADGSEPRQITTHGGGVPLESPDGRTLYYSKPVPGGRRVFAMSLGGGREQSLEVDVVFWNYCVDERGLYYASLPRGRRAPFAYEVRLLDDAGKTTVLHRLELSSMSPGLSVTHDGAILVAGVVEIGQDLFRIDNFR
jgi:Tol biopolymer transport system component